MNSPSGELTATTESEDIDALRQRAEQALRAGASQFELERNAVSDRDQCRRAARHRGDAGAVDLLVKPTPMAKPVL